MLLVDIVVSTRLLNRLDAEDSHSLLDQALGHFAAQLSAVADAFEAAAAAEAATFRDQARDELRAQAAHISDPAARAFSPRRGTCCACRSADRRRPGT